MEVSFSISSADRVLVNKIVDRAVRMKLAGPKHWYSKLTARMDLTATHANGCKLDLDRLLNADDFNFIHDIAGIAKHIDRSTGRLDGIFLPRHALPETVEEAA